MDEVPFPDLNISSHEFLDTLEGRSECPKCQKSRKYYCYTCYVPVRGAESKTPKVKLPLKIDIIKHPSECDGKSTAIHAGVLAPDDVSIYTYPCIPDYPDRDRVVLVFPSENSVTLEELAGIVKHHNDNLTFETNGKDVENHLKKDQACSSESVICDDVTKYCTEKLNDDVTKSCVHDQDDTALTIEKDRESDKQSTSCENLQEKERNESTTHSICDHDKLQNEEVPAETDAGRNLKRKIPYVIEKNIPHNISKQRKMDPPFDRVVFIDSTWNQTKRIYSDERLKGLKQVELKTRITKFWRHQRDNPDTHLSTVEAIYYFVRDYHELFISRDYNGEYDDLLFFFTFMYNKIRKLYNGGESLKAFKQRKNKDATTLKY